MSEALVYNELTLEQSLLQNRYVNILITLYILRQSQKYFSFKKCQSLTKKSRFARKQVYSDIVFVDLSDFPLSSMNLKFT